LTLSIAVRLNINKLNHPLNFNANYTEADAVSHDSAQICTQIRKAVVVPTQKFGDCQTFAIKPATVFCLGFCLSKHKMIRHARNLDRTLACPLEKINPEEIRNHIVF